MRQIRQATQDRPGMFGKPGEDDGVAARRLVAGVQAGRSVGRGDDLKIPTAEDLPQIIHQDVKPSRVKKLLGVRDGQ